MAGDPPFLSFLLRAACRTEVFGVAAEGLSGGKVSQAAADGAVLHNLEVQIQKGLITSGHLGGRVKGMATLFVKSHIAHEHGEEPRMYADTHRFAG